MVTPAEQPPFLPAGLRGGGATDSSLRTRDVMALRRRGRWTQLETLDRYLQKGVLLMTSRALSPLVLQLAPLAARVFSPTTHPDTRNRKCFYDAEALVACPSALVVLGRWPFCPIKHMVL